MKNICLIIALPALLISSTLNGQTSQRQAGIRMGYRSGFFYQVSHSSGNAEIAYNAMLGFSNDGVQITGLRIVYATSLNDISPDLYIAWGYGAHAGFVNVDRRYYYNDPYYTSDPNFYTRRYLYPVAGVDGWLAAEYRVREIPLNISLNFKPYIEIAVPSFARFMPFDLALSVSYVF